MLLDSFWKEKNLLNFINPTTNYIRQGSKAILPPPKSYVWFCCSNSKLEEIGQNMFILLLLFKTSPRTVLFNFIIHNYSTVTALFL